MIVKSLQCCLCSRNTLVEETMGREDAIQEKDFVFIDCIHLCKPIEVDKPDDATLHICGVCTKALKNIFRTK